MIDWYILQTDLRGEVFNDLTDILEKSRVKIEKLDYTKIRLEDRPPQLKETDLKKMKKADLIELLLEKDEDLHWEMDETGALAYEAVVEFLEEAQDVTMFTDENVMDCLRRSFRRMGVDGF